MQRLLTPKWLMGSLLLLLLTTMSALGQGQTLRGRVTDNSGTPLPGVTVLIKGTQNGTATDPDGRFQLNAPSGASTLVISFIGFDTQEVNASPGSEVQVTLTTSAKQLSEVVVVGYGTQKKVNLTGAVSVVSGEQLTARPVASSSLALQGNAPGVTVTQQSGAPGGDGGTIRIRGLASISAGQNPLVLVDNVEMSLDAIDPNNIESISVLKDASAAAIYGSRAANGVVLITTKRGKSGVNVSYNAYVSKQQATDMPEKVSALQHMQLWDVAETNVGRPAAFTNQIKAYQDLGVDNMTRFDTDWKKLVLTNNGMMHNHNVNLSAGTEKVKVFASGSFLDQNGLTANTNYKRTDLRFNTDIALTKKLGASVDMVFNRGDRTWPGQSNPAAIVRYMLGLTPTAPGRFNTGQWGEGWANINPAAQAESGGFANMTNDARILTGTLKYEPVEGLNLLATYSSNYNVSRDRTLMAQYDIYEADPSDLTKLRKRMAYPVNNSLTDYNAQTTQNLFRSQATYAKGFGKHNFSLLGGFSAETWKNSAVSASRVNLLSTELPYLNAGDVVGQLLSGGEERWSMASIYSRFNYNYDEKYLLELNGRSDASSRFRENNWWAVFPSASLGWRISQENFWSNLSQYVNEAKLRASYGALGNQNIGAYYPTYSTYTSGTAYNYYFNNVINPGYSLTEAANPNIQWETSKVLDLGADLGFLNNRLGVTADYFRRDVENMLVRDLVPYYVGLTAPFINIGSMRNSGWELGVNWRDKAGDFSYQVQFNISDVRNKVLDIGGKDYISGAKIIREGQPLNAYYGYIAEGLFPESDSLLIPKKPENRSKAYPFHYGNTAPGDIRYRDLNGDSLITDADRTVLGHNFPRYEYSMNLSAQYKGFDLTAFFQGVGKRDNYLSVTGAQPFYSQSFQGTIFKHQLDYWTPENPGASYPRLTSNAVTNNYLASSYWIKSSAYLRLKNLVLGYTLPEAVSQKVKMKSARLYVGAQNLITWDNYFPGFDPEQIDSGAEFYPIMRTYTVGMNINF
ncbi:MAG: SusC/RagA family TonB-linked outer membrane protein [Adhaeribacter sp.]